MLFSSSAFAFVFLPVVLFVFFLLGRTIGHSTAAAWLFISSLVFYGWDDPWRLVPLICVSITFNFLVGTLIGITRSLGLLTIGVCGNNRSAHLLQVYRFLDDEFVASWRAAHIRGAADRHIVLYIHADRFPR
jgi:hypothetical protein